MRITGRCFSLGCSPITSCSGRSGRMALGVGAAARARDRAGLPVCARDYRRGGSCGSRCPAVWLASGARRISGVDFRRDGAPDGGRLSRFAALLPERPGNRQLPVVGIVGSLFGLALLAKETAIVLPAVLVAYERTLGVDRGKKRFHWGLLAPYAALALVYLLARRSFAEVRSRPQSPGA